MDNPYKPMDSEPLDPRHERKARIFQVIVIIFAVYTLVGNVAFYARILGSGSISYVDTETMRSFFGYALTFALLTLLGGVLIGLTFSYTFRREKMKPVALASALFSAATGILTYAFYADIRGAWILLVRFLT